MANSNKILILIVFLTFQFFFTSTIYATSLTINPSNLTFTPSIAKRISQGPFAVGVFIQGDPANQDTLTDDSMAYGRGSQIGGNFYQTFDASQGSIVLFWTPEYSSTNLSAGFNYLWYADSNYNLSYDYTNDRYSIVLGGQSMTVDSSISAGTSYSIVLRYDTNNYISGSNYACLSINDSHNCGITTQPTSSQPSTSFYLGSDGADEAVSGLIEGFTIYRRVLYDGVSGTSIGNGDEINLIYNSASGRDPTIVTGSFDVVIAIPLDGNAGSLCNGTGSAWTHPHADNLLSNGYLTSGTAWSNWTQIGTPSVNGLLSASNQVFASGYYWTSDAVDEGYYQDITVNGGDDFVARAIVHADANCIPRLELYDQTSTVSIGSVDGISNTSRTSPSQLIVTGQITGSGSKTLRVNLLNTAASGTCSWHSIELLTNSHNDPSYESGSAPSSVGTPTSSTQSTSQVRSGSNSWEIITDAVDEGVTKSITTTANNFYSLGGYIYASTDSVDLNQSLQDGTQIITTSTTNNWEPLHGVVRASSSSVSAQYLSNNSQTFYLDDLYFISLANVALTITPASLINSTEASGVRIDGMDTATQPINQLGVSSGNIKFKYTPRHSASSALSFQSDSGTDVYIGEWYNSTNDTIRLYWSSANTLTLQTVRNGNVSSTIYDATGAILANQSYFFELDYTSSSGTLRLKIDGPTRASLTGLPNFALAPNIAYWGSSQSGQFQSDSTFGPWEDPSLTFSISAIGVNTLANGINTSVASTITSLPFGSISVGTPKYMAHRLSVSTNADSGYTVLLNLLSTSVIQGLDPSNFIDPFAAPGSSWTTPVSWSSPDGTVSNVNTGWIGAGTSDTRVSGWTSGSGKFGPLSTTPKPVMYSSGIDSGTTADVVYALEVNVLQPTDTYSGHIIYTITPTY